MFCEKQAVKAGYTKIFNVWWFVRLCYFYTQGILTGADCYQIATYTYAMIAPEFSITNRTKANKEHKGLPLEE
ncbi:hypothetical protein CUJ83_02450 [Methanocella sp. CWC-04]|uniref:Uncharacterized protein n=1 Tax=Methanooceanicella nereidis TaxID=2052831 RepID=A0AAP2RAQ6_9EURY|nr:hypothetical protein [Methanocella sp. CWC-04]